MGALMTAVVDLTTTPTPTIPPLVVDQPADVEVEPEVLMPELFGKPLPPPSALLTLSGSAAVWIGIALVVRRLVARLIRARVLG